MKLKNLKKLKNYKHYEKLVNKSKGTGPMPQLRWVSNLLTELNIEHRYHDWSETKWRPNGLRYHTSVVQENILVVDYGFQISTWIFVLLILTILGILGVMLEIF